MAWRFPVSAWLVLIGQLLASHGVVLQEAALRGNPVKKVIEMLETMQRKVKSEAAEKEKAFNKYICYCKSTTTTLNSQLAQAEQALPQLQSRVQEVAALQGSLESELAQHKKDGVEAQKAIASASELRQKEAQAFLKDSESQKESVDSVAAAIRALEQGQAESFLQTGSAAVLRRLSLSADMTTRDRDLLSSFLATDSSQPSGSQILGMLKQMKEEMSSSLNEMMGAEQQRIVEHQSLMEAKQKQQQVAMKAMEEKMLRLGELKVETQVLKGDLKDQTEGQKENQQFASDLDKTCSDKQQAWSRYQASEAEELRALSETVQLLSKDEVREKVQAAIYLQRPRRTQSVPAQGWISFLQTQSDEAEAAGSDLVEMALRGQKRGMKDVIQHIEDIHDVLDKEQASDKERQRYCETKLRRAEMTKKDKERDAEDATSIIATFQNELDTVIAEINTLEGRMKDLDALVADATQARQAERAAFEKSRETNSAALELMEVAQKRIQRFYAASFLQEQENATESARLASPPEADLSYRAQGGASQVMLLFGKIKADIQKQTMMLQSDDEVGQSEYENLVKNSNEKKMADNKSLGGKQAARAELEADLQQGRAELRSTQQVLKALAEETRNLHAECDFLLKNFDLREDARRSERRSLTRAKSVLEAADA